MRFEILGSLQVVADRRLLPLGGVKQRALLAALLLGRNGPISVDRLADAVWGDAPPPSLENTVQVYVSRLRRILSTSDGRSVLARRAGGYLLDLGDADVDADDFEQLVEQGTELLKDEDSARAERVLVRALGLWRGPPLADFADFSFAVSEAARLEALRLRATSEWIDASLALGRHAEVISDLEALVRQHPLEERFRGQLMMALYRAMRPSEALAVYRDLRRVLRHELGVDPSRALSDLERAILRQDSALEWHAARGAAPYPLSGASQIERRTVTVLLASLGLPGDVDLEDSEGILAPIRGAATAEFRRRDGVVLPVLGDVFGAVFGAESAHGDDAHRAVTAALAVQRIAAGSPAAEFRAGIVTGDAVVSRASAADPIMISGDEISSALRLVVTAHPGVVLDVRTHRSTEPSIEQRPFQLPSGERVWEAVRERSTPASLWRQAPLVGRTRELAELSAVADDVRETAIPQLVTVVGEPGIGKTRLVREFQATTHDAPIRWLTGRSPPYGDESGLAAIREVLCQALQIGVDDVGDQTFATVTQRISRRLPQQDATWMARHFTRVLGVSGDSIDLSDSDDEGPQAWCKFIESLGSDGLVVLVFEDIHWARSPLREFLIALVERVCGAILIVATSRHDLLDDPAFSPGGHKRVLTLAPLDSNSTLVLVRELLAGEGHSASLIDLVAAKVQGNPLFAEQYARLCRELGETSDIPTPDTVRAAIDARLDTLPASERQVLQSASVFGHAFWTAGVAQLAGRDVRGVVALLRDLECKRFIARCERSAFPGEPEYVFVHTLVAEVSYDRLPRQKRCDLHREAAAWIEATGGSRSHAEALSYQYLRALDLCRQSGLDDLALVRRALPVLELAAEQAFIGHAYVAAADYFEQASALAVLLGADNPALMLGRGFALHLAADARAEEALTAAKRRCFDMNQRHLAAEADALLAEFWWFRGDRARVEAHVRWALDGLDADAPPATAARVLEIVARLVAFNGDAATAIAAADRALCILAGIDRPDLTAQALVTRGLARWGRCERDGTIDLRHGLEVAVRADAIGALPRAYHNLANVLSRAGDPTQPSELLRKSEEAASRLGDRQRYRIARAERISYEVLGGGNWDEALHLADEFVAECTGHHFLEHEVRSVRGAILLGRGDVATALHEYGLALEVARRGDSAQGLRRQLSEMTRVQVEIGDVSMARRLAREVVQGGDTVRAEWSWNVFSLAVVADEAGVMQELTEMLGPPGDDPFEEAVLRAVLERDYVHAADLSAAAGRRTREALLRMRAGHFLLRNGSLDTAHAQLRRAAAFYRSVRASRYLQQIEWSLDASAHPKGERASHETL